MTMNHAVFTTASYLSVRFDGTAVITSVHAGCVVSDGGHVVAELELGV